MLATPWWIGLTLANEEGGVWQPLVASLPKLAVVRDTIRVGLVESATIASEGVFPGMPGFEKALVNAFAKHLGRTVEIVTFSGLAAAREALASGAIDLAPLGFTSEPNKKLLATSVNYADSAWIIAYSPGAIPPRSDGALDGAIVPVLARIFESPQFDDIKSRFPHTQFVRFDGSTEESLFARIDSAQHKYAVIDRNTYDAMQHIYTGVGQGMTVHDTGRAWLTRADDTALSTDVHHFLKHAIADRTVANLKEQYFGHTAAVNSFDAIMFEQRISQTLPQWRPALKRVQAANGIDWRLLASLAYQESQWRSRAVSYTGVQGFMQLTQDTANMYRIDRTNPDSAIAAGGKHLAYLHRATPDRIAEPDRTYFALAAYNIGLGHVEDGRILTQRAGRNPDSWADVKLHLPALANPKVAITLKHGLARGYEAVEYVDRIRSFFEIIVRHESGTLGPRGGDAPRKIAPQLRTAMMETR